MRSVVGTALVVLSAGLALVTPSTAAAPRAVIVDEGAARERAGAGGLLARAVRDIREVEAREVDEYSLPDTPPTHELVNLTRGIRFAPCLLTMAQSPTDPDVMYVGSKWGYIYVTKDGGLSWSEQRVRTARWQFYGSIRPTGAPMAGPVEETRWEMNHSLVNKVSPSAVFDFVEALPGEDLPEEVRHDPASRIRGKVDSLVLGPPMRLGLGGTGGAGSRLGVGLRAGSPWLSIALRKKRGWAMGINMKQTLALFAYPPTDVRWIDVNPNNPDDAFAATLDGLLRTTDGGASWPTVISGATRWERMIERVYRNPHREGEIWVTTRSGLFIATDGGDLFFRITDSRLAQMVSVSVEFHPTDPNVIYVGTWSGLFRSTDGGANFDWIFVRPLPAQNVIMHIALDRHEPRRVIMATDDGLFRSDDGGDTFERSGGFLFTGMWIRGVAAGVEPGHFYVSTRRDMWETFDGGRTWQVVFFGANEWMTEYIFVFPSKPDDIYIVSCAEVLKWTPRSERSIPADLRQRFMAQVRGEPTAGETVEASLRRAHVDYPHLNAYRGRARLKGLVPYIDAGFLYVDLDGHSTRTHRALTMASDDELPPTVFENNAGAQYYYASVAARWDLDRLFFTKDEVPADRYFHQNRSAWWWIRMSVVDYYLERRRLQLEQLIDLDADFRTRFMRALRIEELTSMLNFFSGGLFEEEPALDLIDDNVSETR